MMRAFFVFALTLLMTFPNAAFAEKKETDAEKALDTWLAAVSSGNADTVASLYADDAILLPTLKNHVHDTPAERLEYFKMFTALPKIKGTVNEEHARQYGDDVAINSGIYTFTYEKDGKEVSVPARYSFVFVKDGDAWKVAEHHSSMLPEKAQ